MKSFSDFQRKHVHEKDIKFVPVDGDPDFDLEHNKRVVAETIRKSERAYRERQREFNEGIKERADLAGQYLKSLNKGGSTSDVTKYFGKRYLAYLRGKEVVEMLKSHYGKKEEQGKTENI